MSRGIELTCAPFSGELTGSMSVAMEIWRYGKTDWGALYEPDPDTTIDESRISVVDYDSGGIERGGSHRSWLRGGRNRSRYMQK